MVFFLFPLSSKAITKLMMQHTKQGVRESRKYNMNNSRINKSNVNNYFSY
jgi:hypothetical protein